MMQLSEEVLAEGREELQKGEKIGIRRKRGLREEEEKRERKGIGNGEEGESKKRKVRKRNDRKRGWGE